MSLTLQQRTPTMRLIYTSCALLASAWCWKSSVAKLPLNLTWNIYAFSGSFGAKNAPQDDSAFQREKLMPRRRKVSDIMAKRKVPPINLRWRAG
jgi:hypothetical protein